MVNVNTMINSILINAVVQQGFPTWIPGFDGILLRVVWIIIMHTKKLFLYFCARPCERSSHSHVAVGGPTVLTCSGARPQRRSCSELMSSDLLDRGEACGTRLSLSIVRLSLLLDFTGWFRKTQEQTESQREHLIRKKEFLYVVTSSPLWCFAIVFLLLFFNCCKHCIIWIV